MAVVVTVVALLLAAAWSGLHFLPADFIYGVEAEFDGVPAADDALEAWLRTQPGVWQASVERPPSGGQVRLVVTLGMTQNLWSRPPFPDLAGKCAELGYVGQRGPFRDQPRQK